MKKTIFSKRGFVLTSGRAFLLLMVAMLHTAWAMKPLAPKDGEKRDDETFEEGVSKRQRIDFASLQDDIQHAVDESSAQKLLSLYGEVKERSLTMQRWQEEWETYTESSRRKNAVLWNNATFDVYRTNLCGIIFLETAMNEPHMQLLKNALLPLIEIDDEGWEEAYKLSVQKIANLVGRHHYFRRSGGLYGLIGASGFKNPIASLLFLGAFRSVWEESFNPKKYEPRVHFSDQNEAWFTASHEEVSAQLKGQKETLRLFLENVDRRYVDVDEEICEGARIWVNSEGEEKEKRALFDEKRQLGLPYYSLLYGHCIGAHFKGKFPIECTVERLAYYAEALERGDPRGGEYYACVVNGIYDGLPEDIRKQALPNRMASIKLGDLKALASWKNALWVWKTQEKKNWAKNILRIYEIKYEKMRQFFASVQGE